MHNNKWRRARRKPNRAGKSEISPAAANNIGKSEMFHSVRKTGSA
jgi:hypothetical protein